MVSRIEIIEIKKALKHNTGHLSWNYRYEPFFNGVASLDNDKQVLFLKTVTVVNNNQGFARSLTFKTFKGREIAVVLKASESVVFHDLFITGMVIDDVSANGLSVIGLGVKLTKS